MPPSFYIATVIFILVYLLIAVELLDRTLASFLGTTLILFITYTFGVLNPDYYIISFKKALSAIDLNVIFLLIGMMIITGILRRTGVFQWCAYIFYKITKGKIFWLNLISCFFIAITSAFLDNVTVMLLYTPVLIEIATILKISPFSFLLPGIMASNIGGTATLVGDPPNLLIGSYTGLTFIDFVKNLTPVVFICMLVLIFYSEIFYKKEYEKSKIEDVEGLIEKLEKEFKITDKRLLIYSLFVIAMVISFFITHGFWHIKISIPAMVGAGFLLIYVILTKRVNIFKVIKKDIEWKTLFFFVFLFVLVEAVEEVGLLAILADQVYHFCQGNLSLAITVIIWLSAIMSAFVDNIPFTITMLPIVGYLSKVIPGAENNVLWWALALGTCFGGNGTIIGASANVVTIGMAESLGYKITFLEFMKYAFILMIITVIIANVWLLIF